jgi:hypothetical protein
LRLAPSATGRQNKATMLFDLLFDLLMPTSARGCALWSLGILLVGAMILLWASILHLF